MRATLLAVALAAASVLASLPPAGADEAPAAAERNIKAAFLYKFAGYVEWPDTGLPADEPLTIGVIGADELAGELSRITTGRMIAERPIRVRRLDGDDSLAGLQVLFVGTPSSEITRDHLARARGLPILVVTDAAGALADGSIINFTLEHDRVRFEISLPAAERSRLKLNSRLLAVAQRIQRTPES